MWCHQMRSYQRKRVPFSGTYIELGVEYFQLWEAEKEAAPVGRGGGLTDTSPPAAVVLQPFLRYTAGKMSIRKARPDNSTPSPLVGH